MKPKLKLDQIRVKSFLTSAEAQAVKGGEILETNYSCVKMLTCDLVACFVTTKSPVCQDPL